LETRVPARLSPAEGRRFGLTVGVAFVAVGAVLWWRGHGAAAPVAAAAGTLLVVAGLVTPARLGPVYRGWMGLATVLSRITTPLFLGIAYFGVITPTGLLRRLAGRNPLVRRPSQPSFWIPREAGARRRRDMEHLF
jgi:saxitoxin biosynthesis operon SxtJ-like protein